MGKSLEELKEDYKRNCMKEARNELVDKLDQFIDDESIPDDKKTITLNIIYNLLSMACMQLKWNMWESIEIFNKKESIGKAPILSLV